MTTSTITLMLRLAKAALESGAAKEVAKEVVVGGLSFSAVALPLPFVGALLDHFCENLRREQEEIIERLARIEQKLDAHIVNPLKTGMVYVQEARHASDETTREENLKKAIDAFIRVSNLNIDNFPIVPVRARFYIAVCHDLLADREQALRWYLKSYQLADEGYQSLRSPKPGRFSIGKKKDVAQMKELQEQRFELNEFLNTMTQFFVSLNPALQTATAFTGLSQELKGRGRVTCMAFSPDGALLASGSDDNVVRLWDMQSKGSAFELLGHIKKINCLTFSPDGSLVAAGSDDKTVTVWRVQDRKCAFKLRGHAGSITSVAFSRDASLLATGADDNTVRLWDTKSGDEVHRLQGHWGRQSGITCVAFSPDGSLLAEGSEDFTVNIWDVLAGEVRHHLTTHADSVRSVVFSLDGSLLASGSDDGSVKLWEVGTGIERHHLAGHDRITCMALSPDGSRLAAGLGDDTVRLWDVESGNVIRYLAKKDRGKQSSWIGGLSKLGERIGDLGEVGDLLSDPMDVFAKVADSVGEKTGVTCLAFSPDGLTLATGSHDNSIKLWEVKTGNKWYHSTGHSGTVNDVAFSSDGLTLASGSSDRTIKLWSMQYRFEGARLLS